MASHATEEVSSAGENKAIKAGVAATQVYADGDVMQNAYEGTASGLNNHRTRSDPILHSSAPGFPSGKKWPRHLAKLLWVEKTSQPC